MSKNPRGFTEPQQQNPPQFLFEAKAGEVFVLAKIAASQVDKEFPLLLLRMSEDRQTACWPHRSHVILGEQSLLDEELNCFLRCSVETETREGVIAFFRGRNSFSPEPGRITINLNARCALFPVRLG